VYTHDGGVHASDIRMKENILPIDLGLDFIDQLNPVSFKWKDRIEIIERMSGPIGRTSDMDPIEVNLEFQRTHFGMISQEVKTLTDNLGIDSNDFAPYIYDEENDQYGLRYIEFVPILIKAVQELKVEIDLLKAS